MILPSRACKHEIYRTTHWMYVICVAQIVFGAQMCPIAFDDNVMHINEWAGLNVKIWKCSYFKKRLSVCVIFGIEVLLASVYMSII